jgi:hypothetical protein
MVQHIALFALLTMAMACVVAIVILWAAQVLRPLKRVFLYPLRRWAIQRERRRLLAQQRQARTEIEAIFESARMQMERLRVR